MINNHIHQAQPVWRLLSVTRVSLLTPRRHLPCPLRRRRPRSLQVPPPLASVCAWGSGGPLTPPARLPAVRGLSERTRLRAEPRVLGDPPEALRLGRHRSQARSRAIRAAAGPPAPARVPPHCKAPSCPPPGAGPAPQAPHLPQTSGGGEGGSPGRQA